MNFQAEGYRPPSVFSIFSVGLEYFLPNKVLTSREGQVRIINESGVNNPQSLLFGKVDLLFNVSFVISLLALIFTFSSIAGEKEDGTLRVMMSNPVPRWQILFGKIVGNYVVLLVPFILSLLIALLVLNSSGVVPIFSARILPPFLIILLVSLLFILVLFNLGIFVSTLTHRSITSIVILLFVWTVLVLSMPKISPMMASILYPVESQQVFNLQKSLVRQNLEKELDGKRRELFDRITANVGLRGVSVPGRTEAEREAMAAYDEAKQPLEEEYQQRINKAIRKIENAYNNRRQTQQAIAMNLSRISPVSCYTYVVSEISATGVLELSNVENNARCFQIALCQQGFKRLLFDLFQPFF